MTRVAPQKECPNCKTKIHVKKSTCDCGFSFYAKKNITPASKGIGRSERNAPQKQCPSCSAKCHVKCSKCTCGHTFYSAKLTPVTAKAVKEIGEKMSTSWKDLAIGDTIKSVQGYGPHWVNPKTGEKVYMGSYGKFKIRQILKDGIMVVSNSKFSNNQFDFIYMGETVKSKLTDNMYRSAHKIFRLKRKENNE